MKLSSSKKRNTVLLDIALEIHNSAHDHNWIDKFDIPSLI